jgi:histidine triad (HIT) family protein
LSAPVADTCLFCRIAAGEEPAAVVHSDDDTVAFLDVRPVFEGHVLVIPREHVETLPELPAGLLVPVMGVAQRVCGALEAALGAHGTFVAMNNRVSQSVPHLHVHVVPRRRKDGLRGFFWPRLRYGDGEMDAVAERIRAALAADRAA